MDFDSITLSEIRQRQILDDLIYLWNLSNNNNKLTDTEPDDCESRRVGVGWMAEVGQKLQTANYKISNYILGM